MDDASEFGKTRRRAKKLSVISVSKKTLSSDCKKIQDVVNLRITSPLAAARMQRKMCMEMLIHDCYRGGDIFIFFPNFLGKRDLLTGCNKPQWHNYRLPPSTHLAGEARQLTNENHEKPRTASKRKKTSTIWPPVGCCRQFPLFSQHR